LINRNANSKSFTTTIYPTQIYYGLVGSLSNAINGGTGWLWPGSLASQRRYTSPVNISRYPDSNIGYYRVQQNTILYGMQTDLFIAPGVTYSTIVTVYVSSINNASATPTPFQIGYGGAEASIKDYYTSSIRLFKGDRIALYVSTIGGNNTSAHDLSVQLDLF
jgi:hypothetical protein